jgi:hypothetical protein
VNSTANQNSVVMKISPRGKKTICLPFDSPEQYKILVEDLAAFTHIWMGLLKPILNCFYPRLQLVIAFTERVIQSNKS